MLQLANSCPLSVDGFANWHSRCCHGGCASSNSDRRVLNFVTFACKILSTYGMSTKSILCLPATGRLAVYQSTKFGRRAPRVYQSTKSTKFSTVYQVYSAVDLGICKLLKTQWAGPVIGRHDTCLLSTSFHRRGSMSTGLPSFWRGVFVRHRGGW